MVSVCGGRAKSCEGATSSEKREYCGSSLFPFGRLQAVSVRHSWLTKHKLSLVSE